MALTERLAVVVTSQGVDGVVRDFNRLGGAAAKAGADVESGLAGKVNKALKSVGIEAQVSAAALGAGIATAATLAGAAVARFGVDAINAASGLNEQISATEQTFGAAAGSVLDFGEKAHGALNLTNRDALLAANSFGAFFKAAGASEDQAATLSQQMVRLAGDLSSFKDIGVDEALQRIQSGLSGEVEPLRRLGVFLTEAKVQSKAMELGLAGANGEVSEGAKILARYQLILEGTRDAQGDLERTSGSLANQQRQLQAGANDLKATLGEGLLPVANDIVSVFNGIGAAADKIGGASKVVGGIVDSIPGVRELRFLGGLLRDVGTGAKELGPYLDLDAAAFDALADSMNAAEESLDDLYKTQNRVVDFQRRQADATNRVADAQRKLNEDRAFNNADAVSRAEDDLVRARNAQERATVRLGDAQARLNELRNQDPAKIIADAQRDANDAAAALARAQQDVIDRTDELNRLRDIGASPNEIARGELAVTDANNAVADATAAAAEATATLDDARSGKTRRDEIADAERDVRDATLGVHDATRATADAQKKLNEERGRNKAKEIAQDEEDLRRAIDDQARATGELAGAHGNVRLALLAEMTAYRAYLTTIGTADSAIGDFIRKRIAEIDAILGANNTPGPNPIAPVLGGLVPGGAGTASPQPGVGAVLAPIVTPPPAAPVPAGPVQNPDPRHAQSITFNTFNGLYVDEVERKAAAAQRTRNLLRG